MGHYLFNFSRQSAAKVASFREQAAELLRVKMWGVDAGEPHRKELAPGDLALIYLAAPDREFIGRAEIASAARDWTPAEAQVYPADSPTGVLLSTVEEWDAAVPMSTVLSRLDPSAKAKADFPMGVVRITPHEYETVLALWAERSPRTD